MRTLTEHFDHDPDANRMRKRNALSMRSLQGVREAITAPLQALRQRFVRNFAEVQAPLHGGSPVTMWVWGMLLDS
jgi:hypothetical protein